MPSEVTRSYRLSLRRMFYPLARAIAKVPPTNATVLITGETGTGKELVA